MARGQERLRRSKTGCDCPNFGRIAGKALVVVESVVMARNGCPRQDGNGCAHCPQFSAMSFAASVNTYILPWATTGAM